MKFLVGENNCTLHFVYSVHVDIWYCHTTCLKIEGSPCPPAHTPPFLFLPVVFLSSLTHLFSFSLFLFLSPLFLSSLFFFPPALSLLSPLSLPGSNHTTCSMLAIIFHRQVRGSSRKTSMLLTISYLVPYSSWSCGVATKDRSIATIVVHYLTYS